MALRSALLIATLAGLASITALARSQADAARPPAIELAFDVPPFPAEVARPFSFGFRSVVADAAFLEAIQVLGGRKSSISLAEGAHDDKVMARLLTYATDLDPKFRGAYRFAGNALPRHTSDGYAAGIFAAEALLERGVVERADDWRLHFMLGFIDSYYLEKRERAAKEFAAAAQEEGSPGYLALLATRLAAHSGDLSFAEQLAQGMLAEATEEATRAEWQKRLLDIDMERRARYLDDAVARFRAQANRAPDKLEELVSSGVIPSLPEEPHGGSYFIDSTGNVHSTVADRLKLRGSAQNQSGLIAQ